MSKPLRRHLLAGLAALPLAPARAQAPDFPDRPLRFIVGFPPGGPNDLLTRVIAPGIGERLGRTVVVENKAGANGEIAYTGNAESFEVSTSRVEFSNEEARPAAEQIAAALGLSATLDPEAATNVDVVVVVGADQLSQG